MGFVHSVVVFVTESYLKFYVLVTSLIFIWKGRQSARGANHLRKPAARPRSGCFLPYNYGIYWLEALLLTIVLCLQALCIVLSRVDDDKVTRRHVAAAPRTNS